MPINSQAQHSRFVWRMQKFSSCIVNHITIFQHDTGQVRLPAAAIVYSTGLDSLFASFLGIFSHCVETTYFLLSVIFM